MTEQQGTADSNLTETFSWLDTPSARLFARTCRPQGVCRACLLLLHGYGDHGGRYRHALRWFALTGVATCTFDFRGHGKSSGRRGCVDRWQQYLDDLVAAATWYERATADDHGAPLFVLGHSHGGLVAAAAGERRLLPPSVRGVILSAPYLHPGTPLSPLWRVIAAVTGVLTPRLPVRNGLSADLMSRDSRMNEDSRTDPLLLHAATPGWYRQARSWQNRVMRGAADFRLPLLALIGSCDRVADPQAVEAFVRTAGSEDKRLEVLSGARHEILREIDREETFRTIATWMMTRSTGDAPSVAADAVPKTT